MMNKEQAQKTTAYRGTRSANSRFTTCSALATICLLFYPALGRADEAVTNLPSDTPKTFTPKTNDFDYVKREEMIAMRDGVKLKTFVLIPKGASNAPMLLT